MKIARVVVLFGVVGLAQAQVPGIMSYQGRVTIGGTNFDGTGYFKFALVNGSGTQVFWSNDSSNGPPDKTVALPVSKGSYSVMLGDTSVPGMTERISGSVFDNPDVRLRICFGPDTNLVQQLSPDQRIATVGYAFRSGYADRAGMADNVNSELSLDHFRLQTTAGSLFSMSTNGGVRFGSPCGELRISSNGTFMVTTSAGSQFLMHTNGMISLTTHGGSSFWIEEDGSVHLSGGNGVQLCTIGGDHGGLQFSMGEDGVITLGTPGGAGLVLQGDTNLEHFVSLGLPNGSSLWMREDGSVHLSGEKSVEVGCGGGHLRVASNGMVAIETSAGIGLFSGNSEIAIESDTVMGGTLTVHGDLFVVGEKHFVQAHPFDRSKEIVYSSLEGPEAGTYVRGSAEVINGEVVINLPDHFGMVTSTNGLTVQLTPRGTWLQLYVTEVSVAKITVREAGGRSGKFDYLVQGVRLGYENSPVIRDRRKQGGK